MQTLGLSQSTPKPKGRLRALLWPRINSDVDAATAAQNAMYATFAIAILTAIFVLARFVPASSLGDAALFALLGMGVRQFSITACILAVLLYFTEFVTSVMHGAIGSGIVIAVIVTSLFISAARAAVFMRRHPEALDVTIWTRIGRWTRPVLFTLCAAAFVLISLGLVSLLMTGPRVAH